MDELADPHLALVAAQCPTGHVFHGSCLNYWVNESAMDNANMCPHDRERLCDPRPRIHPGDLLDDSDAGDSDTEDSDTDDTDSDKNNSDTDDYTEADDVYMDAGDSDQEGSDADAEGSDDDLFDMDINEDKENVHRTEELDEAALLQFLQSDEEFLL
jgi:hypothetical protein